MKDRAREMELRMLEMIDDGNKAKELRVQQKKEKEKDEADEEFRKEQVQRGSLIWVFEVFTQPLFSRLFMVI